MKAYTYTALAAIPALVCPAPATPAEDVVAARVMAVSVVLEILCAEETAVQPDDAAAEIDKVTAAIRRGRASVGGRSEELETALAEMEQDPQYGSIMVDFRKLVEMTESKNYYGSEQLKNSLQAFLELM